MAMSTPPGAASSLIVVTGATRATLTNRPTRGEHAEEPREEPPRPGGGGGARRGALERRAAPLAVPTGR